MLRSIPFPYGSTHTPTHFSQLLPFHSIPFHSFPSIGSCTVLVCQAAGQSQAEPRVDPCLLGLPAAHLVQDFAGDMTIITLYYIHVILTYSYHFIKSCQRAHIQLQPEQRKKNSLLERDKIKRANRLTSMGRLNFLQEKWVV